MSTDVMEDIDPETGLPRLPEGLFWDVRENVISIKEIARSEEWVECRGDGSMFGCSRPEHRNSYRRGLFGRKVKVVECRRPAAKVSVHDERYGVWAPPESPDWKYSLVKPDPITRLNLLERARYTLQRYLEEQDRRSIYGEYPPNKLEGGN